MFNEKTYSQKMDKTIEVFQKELTSLRTGRANASMLDLVKVMFMVKQCLKSSIKHNNS